MTASAFDLIIFDCDGTLVDTEMLCNLSTSEVLTSLGYSKYTPDYCLEYFIGTGQALVWKTVAEETGDILPPDVTRRFIDRVAANMEGMSRPTPGVQPLLETVSTTHKICVGSNGERPNVVGALKATNLLSYFSDDCIFTVEDVANPKPAPDLYLYAAISMGVPPARTLVIEDSVPGAAAGVAAGMTVFGYTGVAHHQAEQAEKLRRVGVHAVSNDLADILPFIASLSRAAS